MASTGDIVLVYQEENPTFFARIEDISADRKPDWYQVKLLVLQVPVMEVAWILREAYINGETFTMNEKKIRLELVDAPHREPEQSSTSKDADPVTNQEPAQGKVISLFDRKKE